MWEAMARTLPTIILKGKVFKGDLPPIILRCEQGNEQKIIGKFINVNIEINNNVLFENQAAKYTSANLHSVLNANGVAKIKNAYIRAAPNEKVNLVTISVPEIEGKEKTLVISRLLVSGLDVYILEGVPTEEEVKIFKESIPK